VHGKSQENMHAREIGSIIYLGNKQIKGGKVDGRGRENLALKMKLLNADKSCVGDGRRIERWKVGIWESNK